ncbi:MAG TPA: SRPBCC family protein [Ramlibacter sp.]|nr:SRPBCC family protein [Ramlibacter sp.]
MSEIQSTPAGAERGEIVSVRVIDAPREKVFKAFADPTHLARWWGPSGFRNTFEDFDFRPGGTWRFTMHGPDGTDYPNRSVFLDIQEPSRIVFEHESPHEFRMNITLDDEGGKTRLEWRMRFESAPERDRVAKVAVSANEQNFDRLEAELARMS